MFPGMQMNDSINTNCYICGSAKHSFRPGRVRDNAQLKILECTSCGLVFLSSAEHIDDVFYTNSGMHGSSGVCLEPETWLKETEWDDDRRLQFCKPLLVNKMLLDFGCGAGGFLLKAKNLCNKSIGVEPEIRLQPNFDSKGLEVYLDLKNLTIHNPTIKFDIITLFHVLEHLPDPRETLKELSGIITNDGQLIIEVPNANDALLMLYNSESFSHFTYWSCHLFLFTVHTLKKLAEQSGFHINYIKQIQRYPLSNHLYWLAKDKPGGHQKWNFLDSEELHAAYEKQLASIGCCDTIIASLRKS